MHKVRFFFPNRINRWALCLCSVTLLLGALACRNRSTSGPVKGKQPAPPVEAKGPIMAMIMSSSIDNKGRVVNPGFTFPPNAPQITAIIRVGKITGSDLNLAWYKVSDNGDEKLFEAHIQAKS